MAHLVREVATTGVAVVRPDASLVEAARLMLDPGHRRCAGGRRGPARRGPHRPRHHRRAVAEGADPLTVDARAVCTPDPVCVSPDDAVSTAADLMRRHAVRRLPVVADGRPLGVVSLGDLAVSEEPGSVLADISRAAPDSEDD